MSSDKVQLDHVVILVPHDHLSNPPKSLVDNFVISPGGRHADGKTENRLILFKDGTYVELIAFVDDDSEKKKGHWWGNKPYGIVDYALSSSLPFDYEGLQNRLQQRNSSITYAQPTPGGRKRPDGVEIKWLVTFPEHVERGVVPFWCHDVTRRELRVPVTKANSTHPSGATGMAGITARLGKDFDQVQLAMPAITNNPDVAEAPYLIGTPLGEGESWIKIDRLDNDSPVAAQLKLTLRHDASNQAKGVIQNEGDGSALIDFE